MTVITPSLPGRESQLEEAKKSVWAQTVPVKYLTRLDSERIGPQRTRNLLVESVETEWFLPLDDDDTLDPDCVETLLAHSEGVDVVYPWVRCNPETAPMWQIVNKLHNPARLFVQNYIPVTALIRTDFFRMLGGYRPEPLEDWSLWRRAVLHGGRFRCVPEVLWTYNFHDANQFQKAA